MSARWLILVGSCASAALVLGFPAAEATWQHVPRNIAGLLVASVFGAVATGCVITRTIRWTRWTVAAVVVVGLVPRLWLMQGHPSVSDDVYRYLLDGEVTLTTGRPYSDAPHTSQADMAWTHRINHPEYRTVYPPAAQALFATTAVGHPSAPTRLLRWRLMCLAAELAFCGVLVVRPKPDLAAAWWLAGLTAVEFVGSAHLDIVAIAVFALAVHTMRNPLIGGALTAASVLVKPWVAVYALAIAIPWRHWGPALRRAGAGMLAALIIAWPFAPTLHEWRANVAAFTDELSFNAGPFALLHIGLMRVHSWEDALALGVRGVAVASVVACAVWMVRQRRAANAPWHATVLTALYIQLSIAVALGPQVHPWYWLTVAAVGLLTGRVAWLICCPVVVTSYITYIAFESTGVWHESVGMRIAEFSILAIVVVAEERWRRC